MDRPRFVAVGDVLVDVSVHGGPGHGARVALHAGGSAANTAVWAAAAGADASVIGRVGDDLGGRAIRDALTARHVEPVFAVDNEAATGTFVQVGGRRYVDRGASAALTPEHLPDRLDADIVAVSAYAPAAAAEAALTRSAASWTAALGRPLPRANAVILNETEADEGVHELAARFRLACVTLGELGAIAVLDGEERSASAPRVDAPDPTGAGDAFAAVLLVSLARGLPLRDALEDACRAGARAAAISGGWPVVE